MKRSVDEALVVASDAMETIGRVFEKLSQAEKVDLAARLKPIAKHCETFDKEVKAFIEAKLEPKKGIGTVLGDIFKAERKWIPKSLFRQKDFKEAEPDLYEQYVDDEAGNFQVTFTTR